MLQKTPFSFDVSVWEFFWPLMTGACLVIARPEGHQDPAYLSRLIDEEGVTTLHFVPSMLQAFLEEPKLPQEGSLRRVICSGEALPADLAARFFERMHADGHAPELHNLYGPTEAAVDVTAYACQPGDTTIPIGARRSGTRRSTFWTRRASLCRWVWPVSCTSVGCRSAAATTTGMS